MSWRTLFLTLSLTFLLAVPAAQSAELGDAAAPMAIDTWVKGTPIDLAGQKDKRITVLEFWATWCPPCRANIPHITKLQKKYGDHVDFIGVTDEDAAHVSQFVEKQGDAMEYRVAVDKGDKTHKGYMGAYGINSIPHAFVVDKQGRMVYHGHPMDEGFEPLLDALVSGEFDLEAHRKAYQKAQRMLAMQEEYMELAAAENAREDAQALGKKLEAHYKDDAATLNNLAWAIATTDGLVFRDLDLALRMGKRAVALDHEDKGNHLDTLARVLFDLGRVAEAVKTQEQAVAAMEPGRFQDRAKRILEEYQTAAATP